MTNPSYFKSSGGQIMTKQLDAINRIVPGFYTSDSVDMYGHFIDPQGMVAALEDYRKWGTIREMHEKPIGVAHRIGEPTWNYLEARISQTRAGDEAWRMIEEGVYKGFSIGILVTDGEFVDFKSVPEDKFDGLPTNMIHMFRQYGELFRITGITLVENSVVDRPANPQARLQFSKGLGGASVAGVLPSVVERGAKLVMDEIAHRGVRMAITDEMKSLLASDSPVVEASVETKNVEEIVEDVTKEEVKVETEVVEAEAVKEVAVDEDVESVTADVETVEDVVEDEVVEDEVEAEVVEDEVETVEAEAPESDEPDAAAMLEKILERLDAAVERLLAYDPTEAITNALKSIEPVVADEAHVPSEEAVADSEEEKSAAIDVDALVAEVMKRLEDTTDGRTARVNNKSGEPEPQEDTEVKPDLKSLSAKELSKLITRKAIA